MPKNEKNLIHRMDTSDDWTSVATENACYALEAFDSLPEHLPRFDWDDFQKVSLLGKGATSQVWMVIDNKTKREYALKCLAPDALHTSDEFVGAATDLGMETNMLDKLQHPNIVQLRGICRTSLSESFVDAGKGYFLLTNVLEETSRIESYDGETTPPLPADPGSHMLDDPFTKKLSLNYIIGSKQSF